MSIFNDDYLEGIKLFDLLISSERAKAHSLYPKKSEYYERERHALESMFNYFKSEFDDAEGVGMANAYLAACWKCRVMFAELEKSEDCV